MCDNNANHANFIPNCQKWIVAIKLSQSDVERVAKLEFEIIDHPPYSSGPALPAYLLLPKLEEHFCAPESKVDQGVGSVEVNVDTFLHIPN